MKNNKPFIHLFRTFHSYYVYDVNTDSIVKISKDLYEYLHKVCTEDSVLDFEDAAENNSAISNLIKAGFLSSNRLEEIIHPQTDIVEYILNNKLSMLTLQVTQKCNLRCEYCVYSGNYEHNRTHSNKKMNFETAKKGIDFLINHSMDSNSISIGFYGGEPLLEFELIKRCIIYAEEVAEGKELLFSITTNGTLLNNEVASFLNEHKVSIMISLDGPKEIHDKSRKLALNKMGSFDLIMRNIEEIRKHYPDLYKKLKFNIVIDPENSLCCLNEFFVNYELVKDLAIRTSLVNGKYDNKGVPNHFIIESQYERFKVFLYEIGRLNINNISKIYYEQFQNEKVRMKDKETTKIGSLGKKGHHSGPCIPGALRLFMNVDGNLFPCERVDETSDDMIIGNIDSGFNIEKVKRLLNIGKLTEENCKNCWALLHCSLCAKFALDKSKLSANAKLSQCDGVRNRFDNFLKDYCFLKELGVRFNDYPDIISSL